MNTQIRKYESQDYEGLVQLIQSEGEEWKGYLHPNYQANLEQSITYVALVNEEICGYSRSMSDHGFFVWVIDLLVHQDFRGHAIGKGLLEVIQRDFPKQEIYVMSDVDEYYQKLGYKKEGSIFKIA